MASSTALKNLFKILFADGSASGPGTEAGNYADDVANYLHGVTPGTGAVSQAAVFDSSGNLVLPAGGKITSGFASGRVGGLIYANVADSTAVTSTSTETFFDANIAINANTLAAGSVIRFHWKAIRTGVNGTDTAIFKSYLATNTTAGSIAGTTFTTSATTNGAANDIIGGDSVVTIRTIGSSGTLVASHNVVKTEAASNTATRVELITNSTSINTQTTLTVGVSCTFNSSSSANSAVIREMIVEIF